MKKLSFLILAFVLAGCASNVQTSSTQQGPKESAGAISGMIIGGALANDMAGNSKNKSLATVLGAFVGGPELKSVPNPSGKAIWQAELNRNVAQTRTRMTCWGGTEIRAFLVPGGPNAFFL